MYIQLPKRFRFRETPYDYAEIVNGILHVYGNISFRKLMYKLTFALKGKKECFYCGLKVPKKKMTIDHMHSQDYGGPTIPDNLAPACSKCNSSKSNLNVQQFKIYKSMNKSDKEKYRKQVIDEQEVARKSHNFGLPTGWVETKKVCEIGIKMGNCHEWVKNKKWDSIKRYYEKYGCFQKPIVLDCNGFVLDGYTIFMVAKQLELQQIDVIVLENVELHV